MPVYEYCCGKCGAKFEVLVRSGEGKITCPKCRARKVRKLFSVFGIGSSGGVAMGGGGCAGCRGGG